MPTVIAGNSHSTARSTQDSRSTQDRAAKLWNLCNVLKDDGVSDHQYGSELTSLLFLMMAQETGQEQGSLPQYRWAVLESLQRLSQLDHDKQLLLQLGGSPKAKADDSDREPELALLKRQSLHGAGRSLFQSVSSW